MERHASYALVGVLTTLLIALGVVFVIWLGGVEFGQQNDTYRIVFQGPVHGLARGAEVQFNGIRVGAVTLIRLSPDDASKVVTEIAIDSQTPVKADSVASAEMQGISGVSAIEISAGSPTLPLLKRVSTDRPPLIKSKKSALASLMEGGGKMVENATDTLDRINRLLSDRNLAALSGTISDLKAVSGELASNRVMFDHAASSLAKLDATLDDVHGAATSVRRIADGDGRRAVSNAADAAADLKVTLSEAQSLLKGLSSQSATTLPAIGATMRSLQDTSETIDGLVRQVRQDPRGTLLKGRPKERKLQP